MEELKKYLNALQVGTDSLKVTEEAKDYLYSEPIKFLSDNREEVAELFYQILCSYQRIVGKEVEKQIEDSVIELFKRVATINTDAETRSKNSNLMTIWFLNELYKGVNLFSDQNNKTLEESIGALIEGLDDISFVFNIERDGNKVFPIHHLIADLVRSTSFLDVKTITPYHINVLKLAVQYFEKQDEKDLLVRLKEECGLSFLDYMDGSCKIIDTKDYLNYKMNGVMIFYSYSRNSILIRHEKKEYFLIKGENIEHIQEELNFQKKVIGYYAIIENIGNATMIDFSEVMKDKPIEILKLIYDNGYYNIFHQYALLLDGANVKPINPYAKNDAYMIKGFLEQKGKYYKKDEILQCLDEFRMTKLLGKNIDIVTFGLLMSLLEKENVGVNTFLVDDSHEEDWIQNQMLKKWVEASEHPKEAIEFLLKKYCRELEYCKAIQKFEEYNICCQDLLPYSMKFQWLYEILGLPQNYPSIMKGSIGVDHVGEQGVLLNISNGQSLAVIKFRDIREVCLKDLENYEKLSEDEKNHFRELGKEHYIVYDVGKKKFFFNIEDEVIYKYLVQVELLLQKFSLSIELKQNIHNNQINHIKEMMKLQKEGLLEIGDKKLFRDFDTMVVYRLIHNIIWNRIDTKEQWNRYWNILFHHQLLSFSCIKKDRIFCLEDKGTLYVPKDAVSSDSTFYHVYNEYIAERMQRDKNNPFGVTISQNSDGKYCVNGEVIKKITFLFDNTCTGTATRRTVALYLGKEDLLTNGLSEEKREEYISKLQGYPMQEKIVSVKEIIESNEITEISVHSYYGTDEGVEKVKGFLETCGYDKCKVDYKNKIKGYYEEIKEDVQAIWPRQVKKIPDNFCIFIREFNQPKLNVFPDEMMKDVSKAICMFHMKEE